MPSKNVSTKAKAETASIDEQELIKLERETIVKLSETVSTWYENLGPGLDTVFAGLWLVLKAVDAAAAASEQSGASKKEHRAAAINALAANLAIPNLSSTSFHKPARLKALGGKQDAKILMGYEADTLMLIAQDFPAWYDEVGLSGFLASLSKLVKTFSKVFHQCADDESIDLSEVYCSTAFEMRRLLGKVPSGRLEVLEALFTGEQNAPASA